MLGVYYHVTGTDLTQTSASGSFNLSTRLSYAYVPPVLVRLEGELGLFSHPMAKKAEGSHSQKT